MANYEEVRSQVEELMQDNYKEFSKALVSIEKGIENEQTLDRIYDNFMYDDKASTLFDLDNQDYYKDLNRSNDKSDDLESKKDYWVVEFNEYDSKGIMNDYKGRIVTKDLINELRIVDDRVKAYNETYGIDEFGEITDDYIGYNKCYFDHYVNNEVTQHFRIDIGDGAAANEREFSYLENQSDLSALRSIDPYDELKVDLDPVSYGLYEYFRGGSSNYISDDIYEVADSMVDVYTSDLEASLPDLRREGYYQRVGDEFGLTGDLDKDIMAAQYLRNVDIINENLDDITRNALVYNLEKNEIPITEGIEEIIDNYSYDIDNNNSFYQLLDEFNGDISFELQEIAKEKIIEKGIDPEVLEEYMYNIEDISVDNIPKDMKAIDYINKEVDKTIDDINLDKEQEISR